MWFPRRKWRSSFARSTVPGSVEYFDVSPNLFSPRIRPASAELSPRLELIVLSAQATPIARFIPAAQSYGHHVVAFGAQGRTTHFTSSLIFIFAGTPLSLQRDPLRFRRRMLPTEISHQTREYLPVTSVGHRVRKIIPDPREVLDVRVAKIHGQALGARVDPLGVLAVNPAKPCPGGG